jgi:solute:Na+ symporter, SSS family
MALSNAKPDRFDYQKLFPNSDWEFTRWTRVDLGGFAGCWLVALAILGILWLMLNLGN